MELGLQIPWYTWPNGPTALGADLAAVVAAADDAHFEYIAVMDHFFQIPEDSYHRNPVVPPGADDMLESYTTLGFLAAHTKRAKLMAMMTGALYRPPGLLAKIVTTLDVLSGGRAVLGIGTGWNEEEASGLGFTFPSQAERFELLEEVLRFVLQMWSDDNGGFTGKHVTADRLFNAPQVLSRPHPAIMVGGSGERKTLRLVAKYGQACNLFNTPELERKLTVLRAHCDDLGRDYGEITKTVYHILDIGDNGAKTDLLLAELERLAGLGVDAVIGAVPGLPDPAILARFGTDVIPQAARL
ncbi:probable F420-dependent oxidoreductase, Rv1855c family [Amycolatopsis xylanica]|uniref:Probable F420-dependent oxidoreductase, Rv1855c family n=1 Tax=Amycolatopsis xylanica TaxID=589385 RepID=A0A1H3NHA4_9PSEU|nr:TIGR03560 family F420-dependent LLM class oxidoreductase [Amycolatopsis xylanica]SDY88228.1 probable F420-dependent oxidoreductase, Rv1855c family [Amycolatopsis xylanica]